MASVHLLSAAPTEAAGGAHQLELMRRSAQVDRFGVHRVVKDPADADLIVFVETRWAAGRYFERVRRHPVNRAFRAKTYLFSSADKVIPFLPGVFASIEARWHRSAWSRGGHYLDVVERDSLRDRPGSKPSRLFSFVGATVNDPVRERIMRLHHPRATLLDTGSGSATFEARSRSREAQAEWRERYAQSIEDCAFILCPRGGGPSSRRIFEAMMLGRVPVIVSDQWVPPDGPDWESFSVRVPERSVEEIPGLLESRETDAAAMGARARSAWVDWFSPEASFHRTVEWCLDLARLAPRRAGVRRYGPHLQMLRPYHAARATAKRLGQRERPGAPYWDRPVHRLRHSLSSLKRRAE